MQFEGPEKKFELVLKKESSHKLRNLGRDFWQSIVKAARAEILSEISNENCDAYLLSESSLFVYENRFTMITCGQTTLVDAALSFLQHIPLSEVDLFIYERKDENFPQLQKTSFEEDVKRLKEVMPGRVMYLGDISSHHISLFHLDKCFEPDPNDMTLELLMHGISEESLALFSCGKNKNAIQEKTKIHQIIPGFTVDDYCFDPAGYSINAIKDNYYFTVHVTPDEKKSSYVSFETNYNFANENNREMIQTVSNHLLEIFAPESFNILLFQKEKLLTIDFQSYNLRSNLMSELQCGFNIQFFEYDSPK